jgi:hypothetical protein
MCGEAEPYGHGSGGAVGLASPPRLEDFKASDSTATSGMLSGCASLVAMVQSTDFRERHHGAFRRCLNASGRRGVLVEGQMCPGRMVIGKVSGERAPQMRLVEDDDVIETLAANGSDHPFDVRVLPRTRWCRDDFTDAVPTKNSIGLGCWPMLLKAPPDDSAAAWVLQRLGETLGQLGQPRRRDPGARLGV